MSVRSLEPQILWNHFADLNAVPRPSKKEERVRQFMVDFGNNLGLETIVDKIGNVIIKKPASSRMENSKTVILQSHLDMVHQKNSDTIFDFDKQGIEMLVDGDWVKANGTTLGADNGIGVAAIMAVLSSNEIMHPAVEAFFTIDEETGMTGAMQMDSSLFQGEILLNIDTEDDDELSIGCAGGIDTNTSYNYTETHVNQNSKTIEISIRGLLGGHSGMDIDKGRGNANKWMARILWEINRQLSIQLVSFDGGSLRNAIPREATATFVISSSNADKFKMLFDEQVATLKEEYKSIEPAINISSKEINSVEKAMSDSDFKKIINLLCSIQNGVFRMSPDIEGLVEASSSLARIIIKNGSFTSQSLQRSSVESTKAEVAMAIRCAFENIGCEVIQGGEYPGWKPNPHSAILNVMENLYKEMFKEEPKVKACHAGLECGILGKHLPGVDMISFGPNIRAAHSPDEKVQVSSVQKFWKYYLEILKSIPTK
ncbi:MAG: aminoacyl-histidine dipeptidase [Bacteroidetes bacterium]|nr:aminoacyl-histidine dipeptidase [Bacteroidota bacterium]